ncbi:TPA: hypothetical protein ACPHXK_000428, partial [Pseudomonas aeruginosa]
DQAASIQRRVTTCGGRRKTQPTVRDGLTTTDSFQGIVDASCKEMGMRNFNTLPLVPHSLNWWISIDHHRQPETTISLVFTGLSGYFTFPSIHYRPPPAKRFGGTKVAQNSGAKNFTRGREWQS